MDFLKNITLQNDVTSVRLLAENDVTHLVSFVQNEPEIWTYSLKQLKTAQDLRTYIRVALEGHAKKVIYPFIVFDKRSQAYAGCTRFYNIDTYHKTAMIGYTWYGKAFQGTGLNKNVKYLLLSHAFETLGFERIEFRADVNNARSIRAMKSIGCKVEGILRSNFVIGDKRRDSIVLSILKEEWFDSVKEKLYNSIQ